MHESGHTMAQLAQPMHRSGLAGIAKLYPLEFTSRENSITLVGQATIQTPHPLHFTVSTTIAPFDLAIRFCFSIDYISMSVCV